MGNVRKKNGMMEFLSDKGWEPMAGNWQERIVDMGELDPDIHDTVITHHVGVDKPRCLTEERDYRGNLTEDRRRGK